MPTSLASHGHELHALTCSACSLAEGIQHSGADRGASASREARVWGQRRSLQGLCTAYCRLTSLTTMTQAEGQDLMPALLAQAGRSRGPC